MIPRKLEKRNHMKGQSLVETALFLPILIILLAGIVEVSSLLITQNRITSASRTSAGYGATYYDKNNWQGTAETMGVVALNTVTTTVDLSPDLWDIWSIYGKVNETGDDFVEFTAIHVYGNHTVISAAEWVTREVQVRADILEELRSTGDDHASNVEVVASVPYHNLHTFLNLPVWQWMDFQTVRGLTVMRLDSPGRFAGCPILPVSVRVNQYSAYPTNWTGGQLNPHYPDDPVSKFPSPNQIAYPTGGDAPRYENEPTGNPPLNTATFQDNWPGVPLMDAQPGYIYWARDLDDSGNFGWLCWRGSPCSQTVLEESVTNPLIFLDPENGYPTSRVDMNTLSSPGNIDYPTGNLNGVLEIGEWVEGSTGTVNSNVIRAAFRNYVDNQTPVTMIVFDMNNYKTGGNYTFRVAGFAVTRVLAYKFSGQQEERSILFEFIRWANECGLDDE